VPKHQQFHVAVEFVAVSILIFAVHGKVRRDVACNVSAAAEVSYPMSGVAAYFAKK
jgi:hypothetical protein